MIIKVAPLSGMFDSGDANVEYPELTPLVSKIIGKYSDGYIFMPKNKEWGVFRHDEFPLSVKAIPYVTKLFAEQHVNWRGYHMRDWDVYFQSQGAE